MRLWEEQAAGGPERRRVPLPQTCTLTTPDSYQSPEPVVYIFDPIFAYLNNSVTAPTFKDMFYVLLTVTATEITAYLRRLLFI